MSIDERVDIHLEMQAAERAFAAQRFDEALLSLDRISNYFATQPHFLPPRRHQSLRVAIYSQLIMYHHRQLSSSLKKKDDTDARFRVEQLEKYCTESGFALPSNYNHLYLETYRLSFIAAYNKLKAQLSKVVSSDGKETAVKPVLDVAPVAAYLILMQKYAEKYIAKAKSISQDK